MTDDPTEDANGNLLADGAWIESWPLGQTDLTGRAFCGSMVAIQWTDCRIQAGVRCRPDAVSALAKA